MPAHFISLATRAQVRGSSTACIMKFLPDNDELHCANLGDSGFLVVRNGSAAFQTTQQQHDFNFPFQLGSKAMGAMTDGPEAAQVQCRAQTHHICSSDYDIVTFWAQLVQERVLTNS